MTSCIISLLPPIVLDNLFGLNFKEWFTFSLFKVEKITTNSKGEANGVILADGSQIKAKLILSNATPEVTFNKYVCSEPFLYINCLVFNVQ